jgi:hypothetical protein
MSKKHITVFLCDGKDCSKAWSCVCRDASPGKWLKRHIKEAGLPYKLDVIKTECMDRCEEAACLCIAADGLAAWETAIRSSDDADRLLATVRACAERADHLVRDSFTTPEST